MHRMTGLIVFIVICLPGISLSSDLDATIEACADCHGKNGVSQWDDIPTIAGVDSFVGSEALFIYRDRARPCAKSEYRQGDTSRPATDMCEIASNLSDEMIEDIAAHFSELPFVAAKQDFDATKATAGKAIHDESCERCHSDGGSNADDEAGILAGQWGGYLRTAFQEYASGEREQLSKMKDVMDPLSADDVEALIHFYASQQ
ncbi:MAG TPA: hypothetical protein PKH39_12595 [Woeseiaceae bacterium]|nr:hypothetical protein [Woeseiaceae bacterium]